MATSDSPRTRELGRSEADAGVDAGVELGVVEVLALTIYSRTSRRRVSESMRSRRGL